MPKKNSPEKELYYVLEQMIIEWANDGRQTAGMLAKEIIIKIHEMGYENKNEEKVYY